MIDATPSASELLNSIREFINNEVQPAVNDPALVYKLRIASNLLATVEREIDYSPAAVNCEQAVFSELAITKGTLTQQRQALSSRIQAGDYDQQIANLAKALQEPTRQRLGIDNPKYSTYVALSKG